MKPWTIIRLVKNYPYFRAYVPDHPNCNKHGYVLAHRIVMENKIGRILSSNEIVHHKDENGQNNDPDNLELMTQAEHAFLHKSTGRAISELTCARCGKLFKKETRLVNKNNKKHFCNRTCYQGPRKILCPVNVDTDVSHL